MGVVCAACRPQEHHRELGRIAAKAALKYVGDHGRDQPQVSEQEYRELERVVCQPLEN
jgi:hypothetical protein